MINELVVFCQHATIQRLYGLFFKVIGYILLDYSHNLNLYVDDSLIALLIRSRRWQSETPDIADVEYILHQAGEYKWATRSNP